LVPDALALHRRHEQGALDLADVADISGTILV
jgi:hypothetical protein